MYNIYRKLGHWLLLGLCAGSLFACVNSDDDTPAKKTQEDIFVALDLAALRAHGEDTEDPGITEHGTDVELKEDKIETLRMLMYPASSSETTPAKYNIAFSQNDVNSNRFVFKIKYEDLGMNDLVFIANEPSGKGLDDPKLTREKIKSIKVDLTNITNDKTGSGRPDAFLMTAEYNDAYFTKALSGRGTQSNPYRINLTTQNLAQRPSIKGDRSGAEMMRALAKMEIRLKDAISIKVKEDGTKEYEWALPFGFAPGSALELKFKNIPKAYYLLPRKALTDIPVTDEILHHFDFNNKAINPDYIDLPAELEPSIGGIRTADYKIYVYLPEYLTKKDLPQNKQPGVEIVYKRAGGQPSVPKFYPIQNGGATHYDKILSGLERGESSIYRNRFYKVTVRITGNEVVVP